MPWLALTLEVEAAAAEALSDALLEAGAQSVSIDRPDTERPLVNALLGLKIDAAALLARAAAAAGLAQMPAFATTRVEDEDWVRHTQSQFAPLAVGDRLWIGASWHEPPQGRLVIRLNPGLAFGTGSHPTTRLMLQFLDQRIHGGESVLDYGCGSGILAIAAARLGATRIDAVDVDPQAVETTVTNALANGVKLRAAAPQALADGVYDLVISNILAQPLIVLAPLLAARTARGGRIALAGLLTAQAQEVAAPYAQWFELGVSAAEEGWALLEGARK